MIHLIFQRLPWDKYNVLRNKLIIYSIFVVWNTLFSCFNHRNTLGLKNKFWIRLMKPKYRPSGPSPSSRYIILARRERERESWEVGSSGVEKQKRSIRGRRERWRRMQRCRFGGRREWPTSPTPTYVPIWWGIASRNPTGLNPSLARRSISPPLSGPTASLRSLVSILTIFFFF